MTFVLYCVYCVSNFTTICVRVCGSYSDMNSGTPSEALVDFTGGVHICINLSDPPPNLWELMCRAGKSKSLIGCGTPQGVGTYYLVLFAFIKLYWCVNKSFFLMWNGEVPGCQAAKTQLLRGMTYRTCEYFSKLFFPTFIKGLLLFSFQPIYIK